MRSTEPTYGGRATDNPAIWEFFLPHRARRALKRRLERAIYNVHPFRVVNVNIDELPGGHNTRITVEISNEYDWLLLPRLIPRVITREVRVRSFTERIKELLAQVRAKRSSQPT